MNKATQILMLACAMGFMPKKEYVVKKSPQSEEDRKNALEKAQAKRDRKNRLRSKYENQKDE